MRRSDNAAHQPAVGTWSYRCRRLLACRLEDVGLFAVLRWVATLLLTAAAATYATAWTQLLVHVNPGGGAGSQDSGGPLEVIAVTGPSPGTERVWWSDSYGWPFRCVGAVSCQENSAATGLGPIELKYGIEVGQRGGQARNMGGLPIATALPVMPVSVLFAVNVLIFFFIAALAATAWVVLRDRRRLGAGRCIHCDYPVSPGRCCAECGAAPGSGNETRVRGPQDG